MQENYYLTLTPIFTQCALARLFHSIIANLSLTNTTYHRQGLRNSSRLNSTIHKMSFSPVTRHIFLDIKPNTSFEEDVKTICKEITKLEGSQDIF
jgi:hypothetical protein